MLSLKALFLGRTVMIFMLKVPITIYLKIIITGSTIIEITYSMISRLSSFHSDENQLLCRWLFYFVQIVVPEINYTLDAQRSVVSC